MLSLSVCFSPSLHVVQAEAARPEKNVDLLLLGSRVCQKLGGARTVSCKSAKDRTSVYHTLEVAHLAVAEHVLPGSAKAHAMDAQASGSGAAAAASHASGGGLGGGGGMSGMSGGGGAAAHALALKLADELRGPHGVRLGNCEDNIGRPKYSFNGLQVQALPPDLRPPAHTATGGAS